MPIPDEGAQFAAQLADGCVPVPVDPVRDHAQELGDLRVGETLALQLHDRAAPVERHSLDRGPDQLLQWIDVLTPRVGRRHKPGVTHQIGPLLGAQRIDCRIP